MFLNFVILLCLLQLAYHGSADVEPGLGGLSVSCTWAVLRSALAVKWAH